MRIKLSELRKLSMEILTKSPVEIILSALFLLFGLYVTWNQIGYGTLLFNLKFYFFICFGVTYALNQIFKGGKWRILYYLSLFSPILFYAHIEAFDFPNLSFLVTMVCAFFLIFVSRGWRRDNDKFVRSAIQQTANFAFALVLSALSMAALFTIYLFIVEIFGFRQNQDSILLSIVDLEMYVILPLLFLMFEYNQKFDLRHNRFCEILFNSILTPTLLAYGVILYIYFAQIIVLWELPKGVISVTAIFFLAGGLLVKACRVILDKRVMNRFFDLFGYIALPALGMLWVAVMYRIMEYGFTGNRLYLLLLTVTLSVWIFAQFFKRLNDYHSLMIFTISIFMFFTYAPYINVNRVIERATSDEEQILNETKYIYMYGKKGTVDLEGYRYLVDPDIDYAEDQLTIMDRETNAVLLTISSDELLDYLFRAIDVPNYKELSYDELQNLSQMKHFVYKGDQVLIIFETIGLEKRDTLLKINSLSEQNMRVVVK